MTAPLLCIAAAGSAVALRLTWRRAYSTGHARGFETAMGQVAAW